MLTLLAFVALAVYTHAQTGPQGEGVSTVTSYAPNFSLRASEAGLSVVELLAEEVSAATTKHAYNRHIRHHGLNLTHPVHHAHHAHGKRAGSSSSVPVSSSNGNSRYYGGLTVGSNAVTLNTLWDTGSHVTWYAVTGCTDGNGGNCVAGPLYDATASTTLNNPALPYSGASYPITYGDNSMVTGKLGNDDVTFGSLPSIELSFDLATTVTGFASQPASGLSGLSFPIQGQTRNADGSVTTTTLTSTALPFQYLASGALAEGVFGMRYEAAPSGSGTLSTITFGAPAQYTTSAYQFSPVSQSGTWAVASSGITVNGVVQGNAFNALIDSGTSAIILPAADATAFWNAVPGSAVYQTAGTNTFYVYPCDTTVNAGFLFNNIANPVPITTNSLSLGYETTPPNGNCIGAVVGETGTTEAIIGDPFFTSNPIVFDMANAQIGFISQATPVPSGLRKIRSRHRQRRQERVMREKRGLRHA